MERLRDRWDPLSDHQARTAFHRWEHIQQNEMYLHLWLVTWNQIQRGFAYN